MYHALTSLQEGHWFKLICGASFQHLPAIRSLALAYTLAGADCIDVAADVAVITAVQEAILVAQKHQEAAFRRGFKPQGKPLLMVSFNDGLDPHFRKAEFDPRLCPVDCPRPCEKICPAMAIAFSDTGGEKSGVIEQRCYGCGRCIPVCPSGLIYPRSYVSTPAMIAPLVTSMGIDAIEIHTQAGHGDDFKRLWQLIAPVKTQLKLLAISCPDNVDLINYLSYLYELIQPLPSPLIWQTDGRPMSGDIGKGTTHAAIRLGQKVLTSGLPGYVQLAGGTNDYTVAKLKEAGLLKQAEAGNIHISGVAYGSYGRTLLNPILEELEKRNELLENCPDLLWEAVSLSFALVSQLKISAFTS